jgi:uncharacterized protein YerC
MSYFKLDKVHEPERQRLLGEFYSLMGEIKDKKESRLIFRDLLTFNEIGNLMRRVDVAILLMLGFRYDEIQELLDVGKEKISNVQRKLKSEKLGEGYCLLVERLISARKQRKIKIRKRLLKDIRMDKRPDVETLKGKFKGTFKLWNIIDEFGDHLIAQSEQKEDDKDLKKSVKEDYLRFKQAG